MFYPMFRPLVLGAAAALLCTCTAFAHVTLETAQAAAGELQGRVASGMAARVAHDCDLRPHSGRNCRGQADAKAGLKLKW
jgi:uncharacterized protein YcnI